MDYPISLSTNAVQALETLSTYQSPLIDGQNFATWQLLVAGTMNAISRLSDLLAVNQAKAYSVQLAIDIRYSAFTPIIVLTITDFVLFADWSLKQGIEQGEQHAQWAIAQRLCSLPDDQSIR